MSDDDFEPSPAMQLAQNDPDYRFARFVSGLIAIAVLAAVAIGMFMFGSLK